MTRRRVLTAVAAAVADRILRYTLSIALLGVVGAAGILAGAALPSSRTTQGDPSLVARWHMDELDPSPAAVVSYTTPDSSGNGYTATAGAGVTLAPGRWGNALELAAQDAGVSGARVVEADSRFAPQAVTVLAWVKRSRSPGNYVYIAARGAQDCTGASYALYTGANGGLAFYVNLGQTFAISPAAGQGVWDGNWHAVTGTFDGQTARLFVDGSEVGAGTPAPGSIDYAAADVSSDFSIGYYLGGQDCTGQYTGGVDEVELYSRALSPEEIHYLHTFPGDAPPDLPIPTYPLTVTEAGGGVGSVTSQPGGISCGGTCSASYPWATTVTLVATPAVGSTFAGWSGDCTGKGVCTVTMNQARNVTATFASGGPGGPFALTVTKAGTGDGTVTSTPAGILCGAVCAQSFASGTSVTLHATPGSDSSFSGFSGDCSGTTCTVQMNGARKVTATFTLGPPRNVVLPKINQDRICTAPGRCRVAEHEYSCAPGQWVANDPAIPYRFEWKQLYKPSKFNVVWKHEAYGQTYYAQVHQFPIDNPSGIFRCLVTATGPGGSTVASSPTRKLDVAPFQRKQVKFPTVDIRVTGIEVTQAVQESHCGGCVGTLPSRDQSNLTAPGKVAYQGVTLAQTKPTVVRVYAHVPTGTLAGATAQLEVLDSRTGKTISVLTPDGSPAQLAPSGCNVLSGGRIVPGVCVDSAERANPAASFNFLIPWQETDRDYVTFRATVKPPVGPGQPLQCGACRDNVFTLYNVRFQPVTTVQIHPIPLSVGGVQTNVPAGQVFAGAQTMLPVEFNIWGYDPVRPIDGLTNYNAALAVLDRAADDNLPAGAYPVGVYVNVTGAAGVGPGGFSGNTIAQFDVNGLTYSSSIVPDSGRPITAVAHEIGHGLGLFHADTGSNCTGQGACAGPHPDGTPDCGGNANGQLGEAWPPDNEGRLQSIGLDIRNWQPGTPGSLPSTFVEGFDHTGSPTAVNNPLGGPRYYDFMSYCPGGVYVPSPGNEPIDWISERNWSRVIDYPGFDRGKPMGSAADARGLSVTGTPVRVAATIDPGGTTTIREVTPGERFNLSPTPGSPYRIELRNAAGNVLTSVTPTVARIHVDGQGQRQGLLLAATLPFSPGTAAVAVTAGGKELARRIRSAHPPTGAFLNPRTGSRVGRTRNTVVRWSAQDADGGPLTSTVEYSPDGGRHWKVLADAVSGDSASIPSRFLSASSDARLRVRISDGFDTAAVESGRLHAVGAPPTVQIINPPRTRRLRSGTTLLLQGSASDDTGRPLTGPSLKWYLGSRLIGRGERATLVVPAAGNSSIRLIATDSHGRSAQASLPLHVRAVAAAYLVFKAPLQVPSSARSLRVVVASTSSATFTILGHRYGVTPKARTITLRIKPGRSPLRLACSLRSPGGVIRGTYIVARGQR